MSVGDVRRRLHALRPGRLLTHRFLGLPLFLLLMWVVFRLVTDVSAPFVTWVDDLVRGPVSRWLASLLTAMGLGGSWVESLFVDGVLAGVGGVLAFVPVLLTLYLALALLEDSGYMARGGVLMDGAMRAVGLPGRAFLPMVLGFGCTVPALLATRSLESPRDRVLAGLLVPFMSCGARLPVYVLLASVFFPDNRGTVVFALYLFGIVVAVVLGLILTRTALPWDPGAAVPPAPAALKRPRMRRVGALVAERTIDFIKGAGTVILATSVVVWFFLAIPVQGSAGFARSEVEDSAAAAVGRMAAPLLSPLGLGTWEQVGALGSGLVAKEVVVSTLAQVGDLDLDTEPMDGGSFWGDVAEAGKEFGGAVRGTVEALPGLIGIQIGGDDQAEQSELLASVRGLFDRSGGGHGAAAAVAFMVFVLLYTPCVASAVTMRRELGTRWMWISVIGQLTLAWVVALVVFRIGVLLS